MLIHSCYVFLFAFHLMQKLLQEFMLMPFLCFPCNLYLYSCGIKIAFFTYLFVSNGSNGVGKSILSPIQEIAKCMTNTVHCG